MSNVKLNVLKDKAVVIFSGGQDSTTCLYWAIKNYYFVEAMTFYYGQKHEVEIEQSKIICAKTNIKQTLINLDFLGSIVDSALTSDGDVNETNDKGLPSSFVPNRNQLFITLAHAYAQKIGATAVIGGMCETDFSGYPDCRAQFISSLQMTTNLGSDSKIKIKTPLMYLDKAGIFGFAKGISNECFETVIDDSHTCYNGDRNSINEWGKGCDECPACELRRVGYYEFKKSQVKA